MNISEEWGSVGEDVILAKCILVNSLNSTRSQCNFIRSALDCEDKDGLLNYVELVYCLIGSDNSWLSIFIITLCLITCFIGLGVTADDFLCPSLLVISKTLRLSQNIAGVTFLAFGNGAPDIFSSYAGIKKARAELVIGELFGAGIFVTTVVTGIIFWNQNFKLMERPLIRDIGFYMFATYMTWLIFVNGYITAIYSISFMAIYGIYLVVVIVGRYINNIYRNHENNNKTCINNNLYRKNSITIFDKNANESLNYLNDQETRQINTFNTLDETLPLLNSSLKPKNYIFIFSPNITKSTKIFNSYENNCNDFLLHICPIDFKEWKVSSIYGKLIHTIKAPINLLLRITIPVIDYEANDNKNNWCRTLNTLHCITGPFCILILTENISKTYYDIPIAFVLLLITTIVSLFVFMTSTCFDAPKYHWVFGYLGFSVSAMWIHFLANEVVDMLQAIGIIFSISDVILGLTVLAWGNSIGDLISNISLARNGFPRMGVSACFGGPLLNLLMGIGIPYTIILKEEKSLMIEYSRMITLLYSTITFSLISTLLMMFFNGFNSKRSYGLFLILVYFIYISFALLIEFHFL